MGHIWPTEKKPQSAYQRYVTGYLQADQTNTLSSLYTQKEASLKTSPAFHKEMIKMCLPQACQYSTSPFKKGCYALVS